VPCCQKYTPTDCFFGDFAHWEDFTIGHYSSSLGGKVIKDRKTINRIPQTYSLTTISILWGLAGAGLVLCIGVLAVNIKYRNIR